MDRCSLRSIKVGGLPLILLIQLYILVFPGETRAKRENIVYFPNTAYELNVYKIYGKKPGKTLMLIGGIQGNEPGGFLSADLYADMSLMRGNLIVVPRANFYSILLNHRGPHGDMNRKFAANPKTMSMDDKIVSILKQLIAESDYLLNLHDGSGYYHPTYISRWRNPSLFGQSIIADCECYRVPGQDGVLRLGEMARRVVEEINRGITNELHRFHFNNTRTDEPDSIHREQTKSATYYALTKHHIPAFGVETSKFLPSIDLKVRYHNLAINAFMRLFGIVPEQPRFFLDSPELKYLVVSINGQIPIVIRDQEALHITNGDTINIAHVEANYERGLSVDILGYGSLNDFRKDISINRDTKLLIRKDNKVFAAILIQASPDRGGRMSTLTHTMVSHFIVEVDGRKRLIENGETLEIIRGDSLKVIDILPKSLARQGEVIVNFKGFVGNWKNNTGEDRGYSIDTAHDLLKRYSIHGKRRLYRIVVFHGKEIRGTMFVSIAEPSFEFLIVSLNDQAYALKKGQSIDASMNDYLSVEAVKGNVGCEDKLHIRANGDLLRPGKAIRIRDITGEGIPMLKIDLSRGELFLGEVYIRII
jgi:hypothetical protein